MKNSDSSTLKSKKYPHGKPTTGTTLGAKASVYRSNLLVGYAMIYMRQDGVQFCQHITDLTCSEELPPDRYEIRVTSDWQLMVYPKSNQPQ